MLAQDAENTGILISEVLLQGVTDGHAFLAEPQGTAHLLIGTDIELCHVNMADHLLVERDGSINLLFLRTIYIIMSLHAYTINGHPVGFHLLDHFKDATALDGIRLIVVVVEQQRIGVGLTGISESLSNEFIAGNLVHHRLTVGIFGILVIGHRFINDIPTIDNILVPVHNCVNMFTHPLKELVLGQEITLLVLIHPVTNLGMPHQAVTTHFDAVLATKVSDAVGTSKIKLSLSRFSGLRLHIVLSSDAVEFTTD